MDDADVPGRIEHTVLGPTTTPADVRTLLEEASEYGMRACVPPCYVSLAAEYAPDVPLSTVVGFPHGQHTPETKCREANELVAAGADEIDVVANIGLLLAGEDEAFQSDVAEVVAATAAPVKAIVQAPSLTAAQLHRAAEAVADADAAFLKTATGFGEGGATVDDVALLSTYLPVKASGGIGTAEAAREMFDAGATRIGASSGVEIVDGYQ